MWEFSILFVFTLAVYLFFFVTMRCRQPPADDAHGTGHTCGHAQCQCTHKTVVIEEEMARPTKEEREER